MLTASHQVNVRLAVVQQGGPSLSLQSAITTTLYEGVARKVPAGRWLGGVTITTSRNYPTNEYVLIGHVEYLESHREAINRVIRALLARFKRAD